MFKDRDFTENDIYQKLLSDKLSVNLGYLYENAVAQTLAAKGDNLYYHTIWNESSRHYYEVDFLISRNSKVCPIEAKSSGYKAHKSLDVFYEKHSAQIWKRYLIYTKDLKKGCRCALPAVLYGSIYLEPFASAPASVPDNCLAPHLC